VKILRPKRSDILSYVALLLAVCLQEFPSISLDGYFEAFALVYFMILRSNVFRSTKSDKERGRMMALGVGYLVWLAFSLEAMPLVFHWLTAPILTESAAFLLQHWLLIYIAPAAVALMFIDQRIRAQNQSTDPTLASGTPLAEPESRHP
jgi:hypothetical protein